MTKSNPKTHMARLVPSTMGTFTFVEVTGASWWVRVKLGFSLLLAPLTVALIGRTIGVQMDVPEEVGDGDA